jgi:hypothetical protein
LRAGCIHPTGRHLAVFLSDATADLALALPAGPAPAAAVPAARNGIGASHPEMILTAGG